jgi:carboxylesterase
MNKLCRILLSHAHEQFRKDRIPFLKEKELKPKDIGRPFLLEKKGSRFGVLLTHGYLASPEEVRPLAEHLYNKGYSVYAPRLPGHGTSPEDLLHRTWQDWYGEVVASYELIRQCAPKIIGAGFSAGALLSLVHASLHPERFCGIVALSAPLRMSSMALRNAQIFDLLLGIQKNIHLHAIPELITHHPDNPEINYIRNSLHGVAEIARLSDYARGVLAAIKSPVIAIQADHDPIISHHSPEILMQKVSSEVKESFFVNHDHHGILRGSVSKEVFLKVDRFLERIRKID